MKPTQQDPKKDQTKTQSPFAKPGQGTQQQQGKPGQTPQRGTTGDTARRDNNNPNQKR